MLIADLIRAMESIAPTELAESWDNVGLLLGDRGEPLRGPVMLTIDLDDRVLREAIEHNAGAIVAYHPPLFTGIKRITGDRAEGRRLLELLARRIAVYSPHTALDAAAGGVCDWLLEQCAGESAGVVSRGAIVPAGSGPESVKLVTFVPTEPAGLVDLVREALAAAGAGRIGRYDSCSFRMFGTGSFRGGEGSNPAVGAPGRMEFVDEHRLEMVCPARMLPQVIAALRGVHPYEEPAFDVYPLQAPMRAEIGAGRIGTLRAPAPARDIGVRLKAALRADVVQVASPDGAGAATRVAVCPGSGASLLDAAIDAGAEVFVTGEMKHHEVRGALERGVSVVLAGHTETERGYLPRLAERLGAAMAGVKVLVSERDGPVLGAV